MIITTYDRIRALREGGHTKRCHVIPFNGHYDVAMHTWHLVTLLYLLHPDPSPALIRAAHFHDVAERWVGDIPATAKWMSSDMKYGSEKLETRIQEELGVFSAITEEELSWLKGVDMLELYLWTLDQIHLGNNHVLRMHSNIQDWLKNNGSTLPEPVFEVFQNYQWERTSDYFPTADIGGRK